MLQKITLLLASLVTRENITPHYFRDLDVCAGDLKQIF